MKFYRSIVAVIVSIFLFSFAAGQSLNMPADTVGINGGAVISYADSDSLLIAGLDSMLNTINLDEVVVVAPVKPITIKGDTTIINTSAFKTRDGAYLEDLVRLIPGMAYDKKTGSLTYNGIPLTDININGESFFKDGKTLALENLRADLFSKIKIYDKASDEDKFMGLRGSGKNYVLDLQTHSEFNGSLMTSAEISYGNRGKKNAALSANAFRPKGDNFALNIGSGNRDMTSDYKRNRSDNASFHVSHRFSKKFHLLAGAMYDYSRMGQEYSSSRENYLPGGNTYNYSQGNSINKNKNFRSNLSMNWTADKMTMITLAGTLSTGRSESGSDSRSAAFDENPGLNVKNPFEGDAYQNISPSSRINGSRSTSLSKSRSRDYSLNASLTRRLNEKGSALSLNVQMSDGKRTGESFNENMTDYYRLTDYLGRDSVLYRDQYNLSPTVNRSQSIGLRFVQPFAKGWNLELSYRYKLSRERYSRSTYDLSSFHDRDAEIFYGELPDGYRDAFVDSLSNHSFSHVRSHEMEVRLMYSSGSKWYCYLSLAVEPERRSLDQKTGIRQADTVRSSVNFRPSLNIDRRFDKWNVRIAYTGTTMQPDLSSLLSLTDNSNPLNISRGNPDLKATYRQDLNFEVGNMDLGLSCDASLSNSCNDRTLAVYYNPETGGRVTTPVNINGNRSGRLSLRYFKYTGKMLLSANLSSGLDRSVGMVNEDIDDAPRKSVTLGDSYGVGADLNYMPKWGGIQVRGAWNYRHSTNDLRDDDDRVRSWSFTLSPYTELPFGLHLGAEFNYSLRTGTNIIRKDNEEYLLNADIRYRFLKSRSCEITFEWKDILNNKKNYQRSTSYSGVSESYNPSIGSYFLFSFRYRFNKDL